MSVASGRMPVHDSMVAGPASPLKRLVGVPGHVESPLDPDAGCFQGAQQSAGGLAHGIPRRQVQGVHRPRLHLADQVQAARLGQIGHPHPGAVAGRNREHLAPHEVVVTQR